MKFLSKFYMLIVFALLYAPIVVLIVFSFNDGGTLSEFTGISLKWYGELFRDHEALTALKNSLILAVSSSVIARIRFDASSTLPYFSTMIGLTTSNAVRTSMVFPDLEITQRIVFFSFISWMVSQ